MVERVVATPAALALIETLKAKHGELMFHQSGGCCDGSAPMCYPRREFLVGTAEFVHRYGAAQFAERMRFRNIAEIWQDYLAESSHSNRTSSDPAMRRAFCRVLVRHYNKGLSSNSKKRLVMEG